VLGASEGSEQCTHQRIELIIYFIEAVKLVRVWYASGMEKIPDPIEEDKARLQVESNFDKKPGRHTLNSDIVAARLEEMQLLKDKLIEHPELRDFESALYQPKNIYLIPVDKKEQSEEIAERLFEGYIKKFEDMGATVNNVVAWVNTRMPGVASNKMHIYDVENKWNTWTLHAIVEDEGTVREDKYLPKYVAAYHELMHVEETPKGVPTSYQQGDMAEILTTIKTITLIDQIYKEIFSINFSDEVDYKQEVDWGKGKIRLGWLANFYRNLEQKYNSVGRAVVSEESLKLIQGWVIE